MRDEQCRAPRHEVLERIEHARFGRRVEGAGGLIEDQNRGIGEERSRQGEPLSLTGRELFAALTHHGGAAGGHGCHQLAEAGGT